MRIKRPPIEILLILHTLLLFFWMLPEVQHASIYYNDVIAHIAVIRRMDQVWSHGGNILDFWMANINMGHAFFRSYQFLLHLFVWTMHKTVFFFMPLETAFNACILMAVLALPWSIYAGARLLGLTKTAAVVAAIAATLFSEKDGYGLALSNYTFSGYGIDTQLFAFLFFPLAAGFFHRAMRSGRGLVRAAVFFALTLFSHILIAYFGVIWLLLDFLVAVARRETQLKPALWRLCAFAALVALYTGFWVFPMAADNVWQHHSSWETLSKYSGLGAKEIVHAFANGSLLDWGRIPVLSTLALMGFLIAPFLGDSVHALVAVETLCWFLLSFGPLTWGRLLTVLPYSGFIHWHRAFALFEFAAALCAGVAVEAVAVTFEKRRPLFRALACAAVFLVFLPALLDCNKFFRLTNAYWIQDTEQSWKADTAYHSLLQFAQEAGTGAGAARFNAGTHASMVPSWGDALKVTRFIPAYGLLAQFGVESVGPVYMHQNHTEEAAFRHNWQFPEHNRLLNIGYLVFPKSAVALQRFQKNLPPTYKETRRFGDAVVFSTGIQGSYFDIARPLPGNNPCADSNGLTWGTVDFLYSALPAKRIFPIFHLSRSCPNPRLLSLEIEDASRKIAAGKLVAPEGQILAAGEKTGKNSGIYWAEGESGQDGQMLVFKMNFHPNWTVLINGVAAEKSLVAPAFIGVPLKKGKFRVEAFYDPGVSRIWLALGTLALLLACIALRKKKFLKEVW